MSANVSLLNSANSIQRLIQESLGRVHSPERSYSFHKNSPRGQIRPELRNGHKMTSALRDEFSPSYPINRGYNRLLITQSRGRQHASQRCEGLPLSFPRNRNLPASIRPEDLRGASRNRRR